MAIDTTASIQTLKTTPQAPPAREPQATPVQPAVQPPGPTEAFTVTLSPAAARLAQEEPPPPPPEEATAPPAAETENRGTEELRSEGTTVEEPAAEPFETTPPAGGANTGQPVQPNISAFQQGGGAVQGSIDILA